MGTGKGGVGNYRVLYPVNAAARMALPGETLGALGGSRHLPVAAILMAMAMVLVIAGGKMLLV